MILLHLRVFLFIFAARILKGLMKGLEDYILPIKGMKLGKHHFDYRVDDHFFQAFDYGELQRGSLDLQLEVEKKENMMQFTFEFNGSVLVPCDRCLDDFELPLESERHFILKVGEAFKEEDDDVVVIPDTEHQFDISELLHEYIHLALPMQKIHPEDTFGDPGCNKEMLAKLSTAQGGQYSLHSEEEKIDPRWEALRKLKQKKE